MSWQSIESDPSYQALPEDRKSRIKENYFEREIAPKVPKGQYDTVRASFGLEKKYLLPKRAVTAAKAAGRLIGHSMRLTKELSPEQLAEHLFSYGGNLGKEAISGALSTDDSGPMPSPLPDLDRKGIVDRITSSALAMEKQLKTPPSEQEREDHPIATALHITRPMRALSAFIDESLPEFAAYQQWEARSKLGSLKAKVDDFFRAKSVYEHGVAKELANVGGSLPKSEIGQLPPGVKVPGGAESFAGFREPGKAALAGRAVMETISDVATGLGEFASSFLTPSGLLTNEAFIRGGNVAGRALLEKAVNTAPEAMLKAVLPVENALKKTVSWEAADRAVAANLQATYPKIVETVGDDPVKIKAAMDDVTKRSYEVLARKAWGLKLRGAMTSGGEAPPFNVGKVLTDRREGPQMTNPFPQKPQPVTPQDVAGTVAAAGVEGQAVADFASQFPSVYSALSGHEVLGPAKSAFAQWSEAFAKSGKNPTAATVAAAVKAGQVSLIEIANLNKAIFEASASAKGVPAEMMERVKQDAQTAASQPAETLAIHHAEQADRAAFQKAKAEAQKITTEEAIKAAKATMPQAETPPPEPTAPSAASIAAQPRAEVLSQATDPAAADELHRSAVAQGVEQGDPQAIQEAMAYAEDGDTAFDPAELEAMLKPPKDTAQHPAFLSHEEFAAEFPDADKSIHSEMVGDAEAKRKEELESESARVEKEAGIAEQPAVDFLVKNPISEAAIKKLGLTGDFKRLKEFLGGKRITTKKGGLEVDQALTAMREHLRESGLESLLPDNPTPNDMMDLLEHQARGKGYSVAEPKAEYGNLSEITPAFKDPKTGKVYTGENHRAIAEAISDPELKKVANTAAEENNNDAGFVENGKFMTRDEAKAKYGFRTSQELEGMRGGVSESTSGAFEYPRASSSGPHSEPSPQEAGKSGGKTKSDTSSKKSVAPKAAEVKAPSQEEQQLAFNLGGEGIEQYVKNVARQIRAGRKYFPNGKVIQDFVNDLEKNGFVSYVGKEIRSPVDAAELFKTWRNPALEHFSIILVKDGKVVAHPTITSGAVGFVVLPQQFFDDVKKLMQESGADSYYFAHNHPSGDPTPSLDDRGSTLKWAKYMGPGFKGHVVIDDTTFTLLDQIGSGSAQHQLRTPGTDFRPDKTVIMGDAEAIRIVSKEFKDRRKIGLLMLDSRNKILGFDHVIPDDLKRRAKEAVRHYRASGVIAVVDENGGFRVGKAFPAELLDVIFIDGDKPTSLRQTLGEYHVMENYSSGEGAYQAEYGSAQRVAEDKPRYMSPREGMDLDDFKKAIAEAKVQKGSELTLRVGVPGFPRGTKAKVLAVSTKNPRIIVGFEGDFAKHVLRPEVFVETFRKPAARQAVEAAEKATGEPSQPIKQTIKEQQAGLSPDESKPMSEMDLLAEKFKNQAKGAKIAAAETRRKMQSEFEGEIHKMQDKLDKLKVDAKNAKYEARWMEAFENKIRSQLVTYINEVLPPSERGRFLTAVAQADTISKMGIALNRVADHASLIHKKAMMTDIRKLVERVTDSSRVDVKFRQAIKETLEGIQVEGKAPQTYKRLRETLDFITQQEAAGKDVGMPKAVLDELDILGRRPLKELSEVELEEIFLRLQMLEDLGRTTVKVREALYFLERERVKKEIISDLKPIESRKIKLPEGFKDLGTKDAILNDFKKKLNWAYEKYSAITPPDVMWDMMSRTGDYAGPMVKHFAHGIGADYSRHIDLYWQPIEDARAIIDKHKLTDEQIRKVTAHSYLKQPGGDMYLRSFLDDGHIKEASTLTPQETELYQAWRKSLDSIYSPLKDSQRFNDNMDVGFIPEYFPVSFDPERALDVDEDLSKRIRSLHEGFQKNIRMGALEKREGSNNAVLLNGQRTFEAYMRLAAYKIAMSRRVRMLGEIVNSKDFQEAAGDFGARFAKDFVTMMARRGAPRPNQTVPWMDNVRRNASVYAITFRLPTALVHMTLLSNAAAVSGPSWIFGGMRKWLSAQAAGDSTVEDYLRKNHPEYRMAHGNDPVFQDAADIAKWGGKEWWKAINTPTTLRWIVRMATASSLLGNEMKWLEQRGLKWDPELPNQDALNHAALMTRRAIASPELPHMFLAYNFGDVLTGNLSGNRALTQFHNFPLDRWSTYAHDLPAMVKKGNYGAAASFLFWQTMGDFVETGIRHGYKAGLSAILAGLGIGAAYEMDDDHHQFWMEFMTKLIEKPPFVPDIINLGLYGRVPTTVFSLASDAVTKAFKAERAHALADNHKALQNMTESIMDIAAMAYPIPGGGTIQQVLRMVLADGGIRFPYYDERTRLNNLNKQGRATQDELDRRRQLNHVFARFEKMNHSYKQALKDGDRKAAADILANMNEVAKEARP